jgi:predicted aldo/keto reductase-like oxidoreductase
MGEEEKMAAAEGGASEKRTISGALLAAAWLGTVLVFYVLLGDWVGRAIEGMDRSLLSRVPLIVSGAALLGCLVLTVIWARGLFAAPSSPEAQPIGLGRRRFLAGAAGVAAGLGGILASLAAAVARNAGWVTVTRPAILPAVPHQADRARPEWSGARIRSYRRLGRTGFDVSDISLGSGRIKGDVGEQVAREAIARGVNYFDTAPDYSEAGSELALGRAMKGHRDQMFLATKFCTPAGNLPAGTSVAGYIAAVEASLGRLQTDRVDLVHIHSCDTLERLMDPNVHEAFDRLREQGKARFMGFSSHSPNLEQVANKDIESGRFDVMMLAYHHGAWPQLADIVDRAHAIDMGVVAMKTLKGAKHRGLLESRDEQDSYTQAAFKWVLANPSVSCLVISFREPANVDEYLYASGKRPTDADHAILQKYDQRIAGKHCYPHCGACLDSCPEGLPINDVLRHRMYFEDYGDERQAMLGYSKLDVKADVCTGCSAPCATACPFGVPIPEYTRGAHRMLSLV